MRRFLVALVALALLGGAGCGAARDAGSGDGLVVVTALYPLEFVAAEVGAGRADVTNLAPPGVEPHDLELAPNQVRAMSEADLLLYIGEGFQPAIEDLVDELPDTAALDALDSQEALLAGGDAHADEADDDHSSDEEGDDDAHEEEGATDPHVWLDPTRLAGVAAAAAEQMAELDPTNAGTYEASADALVDELSALDEEYTAAVANCERDELVVSHEAFGYLTDRYGLEQVGVSGLDPEAEPSPGRVAEVSEFAREHGVTTIFFEEQVAPDIAEVIADEAGAETEVLDPLEFTPDGGSDYFDVMRSNLKAISAALDCS